MNHHTKLPLCLPREYAYRDKERGEERAEEDRSLAACATFLVGEGRG